MSKAKATVTCSQDVAQQVVIAPLPAPPPSLLSASTVDPNLTNAKRPPQTSYPLYENEPQQQYQSQIFYAQQQAEYYQVAGNVGYEGVSQSGAQPLYLSTDLDSGEAQLQQQQQSQQYLGTAYEPVIYNSYSIGGATATVGMYEHGVPQSQQQQQSFAGVHQQYPNVVASTSPPLPPNPPAPDPASEEDPVSRQRVGVGGRGAGGAGGVASVGGKGQQYTTPRPVVNAAPQGPPGLFGPDDWPCTSCGNVNWARRPKCNLCGAPKPGTVDQTRQGYGGGFKELDEKEIEEAKLRRKRFEEEDDDIYDDFGRVKKKHRTSQSQSSARKSTGNSNRDKKRVRQKGALERLQGEWLV